jgi:hypothetical protein
MKFQLLVGNFDSLTPIRVVGLLFYREELKGCGSLQPQRGKDFHEYLRKLKPPTGETRNHWVDDQL